MLNGIYSMSAFLIFTHLPIGALLCDALENLPGLCGWICAWNVLLEWGTLQIIVTCGVQRWGCHSKIIVNTIIIHVTDYVSCTFLPLKIFRLCHNEGVEYLFICIVEKVKGYEYFLKALYTQTCVYLCGIQSKTCVRQLGVRQAVCRYCPVGPAGHCKVPPFDRVSIQWVNELIQFCASGCSSV
jgi:hypothetical protein